MKRTLYTLRLALRNLHANAFTAVSTTLLLMAGMVLTMLAFGYIRMLNVRESTLRPEMLERGVMAQFQNVPADASLAEAMLEPLRGDVSWQAVSFASMNKQPLHRPGRYSLFTVNAVDQAYVDRLAVPDAQRESIRQKLAEGYLVLGTDVAGRLGLRQNDAPLYVGEKSYPVYIAQALTSERLLDLSQAELIQGKAILTLSLLPAEGIEPDELLRKLQSAAEQVLAERGISTGLKTYARTWENVEPLVASIESDRPRYALIAFSAMTLALLVVFAGIGIKLEREKRDAAVKLALGARWGDVFLQQLTEMLLCAAAAMLLGAWIVYLVQTRVLQPLFLIKYIVFDGYAVSWGAAMGALSALIVACTAFLRLRRMNLQTLIRGDA